MTNSRANEGSQTDALSLRALRVLNNESPEKCRPCGGQCCKNAPGIFHPDDFDASTMVDDIAAGLADGRYSVDWWEGSPTLYYVRPATTKSRGMRDPSWGGQCVLWSYDGCRLKFDDRPAQCRALEPAGHASECSFPDEFSKHALALAWHPFEAQIDAALERAQQETK